MKKLNPRKLTKCPKCKSTSFWITEVLTHDGDYEPDAKMILINTSHSDNETTEIICKECGKQFDPSLFKFEYW